MQNHGRQQRSSAIESNGIAMWQQEQTTRTCCTALTRADSRIPEAIAGVEVDKQGSCIPPVPQAADVLLPRSTWMVHIESRESKR